MSPEAVYPRYLAISLLNIAQTLCPWVQGILILFSDFIWFIPYPDRVISGVCCIGTHWYIISITSPLLSFNGLMYNFCVRVSPQTICLQAQCTLDISRSLSYVWTKLCVLKYKVFWSFSYFICFIPYIGRVISGVGCVGVHWYINCIIVP